MTAVKAAPVGSSVAAAYPSPTSFLPKLSARSILLIIVKILLVVVILFLLPKLVIASGGDVGGATAAARTNVFGVGFAAAAAGGGSVEAATTNRRNKHQRRQQRMAAVQIRQMRFDCALEVCAKYVPEESLNCVFSCLSPSCYQRVYGMHPLEDGEVVDTARAIEFDDCVKNEFRDLNQRRRVEKELFAVPK